MNLIFLIAFVAFSDDLSQSDFNFTSPTTIRQETCFGWDQLFNELERPKVAKKQIFDNYKEVYNICKAEGRKLTVIKGVDNLEPFVSMALARGDYVYLADGDDMFPNGVRRYNPNLPEAESQNATQYQWHPSYENGSGASR